MKYRYHLLPSFIFLFILALIWITYPEPVKIPECGCTDEIIEVPVTGTYSFKYDPCTEHVKHNEQQGWGEMGFFEARRIKRLKSE